MLMCIGNQKLISKPIIIYEWYLLVRGEEENSFYPLSFGRNKGHNYI